MTAARISPQRGWVQPVLGFVVALSVATLGQVLPVNVRLVTLSALILPIPGLAFTTAITELALGHLSAGSARLAGAATEMFTLVLGVAIAWRVVPLEAPPNAPHLALPAWAFWVAAVFAPPALAVVFKAPFTRWPAITIVCVCGIFVNYFSGASWGPEIGAVLGAFTVGCGSNLYARVSNRPAMVPQTLGLLILVPGSVGYRSLTAMLDHQPVRSLELAFSTTLIATALAGGLLLASLFVPPNRHL